MVSVTLTPNLHRHVDCRKCEAPPGALRQVLNHVMINHPQLRSYVLDDQGAVRRHVAILIDGRPVRDREHLSDPVQDGEEVFILQALSGG